MTQPHFRETAVDRIRHKLTDLSAEVLCTLAAPAMARRIRSGRLAILMYHGVEPQRVSPSCWHVLDTAAFRRQLEYLDRHFTVLPLEEALERLEAGTLPQRAAAITFDDGTQNLLTHAAPVLREMGLPAAVFLATGVMGTDQSLWPDRLWLAFARTDAHDIDLTPLGLGKRPLTSAVDRGNAYAATGNCLKSLPDEERISRLESLVATLGPEVEGDPGPFRMLSWAEAQELANDGLVTLYPHTVTHPILSTCSDAKVEWEIAESCRAVARETGSTPKVFAYPNGRDQDFDERAKAVLRRNGVRWALSTTSGLADRRSDPLALPRVGIGNDLSFGKFRLLVSGAFL